MDVTYCVRLHTLLHAVACCCPKFQTLSNVQKNATTPNNVVSVCTRLKNSTIISSLPWSFWCFFWFFGVLFFVVRKVRISAAQKLNQGQNRKQWGRVSKGYLHYLLPSPPPPLFSFSSAVQLSCSWVSYFTIHTRKNTPRNRQQWG